MSSGDSFNIDEAEWQVIKDNTKFVLTLILMIAITLLIVRLILGEVK